MKTSSITAISGFVSVALAQHNHHARHHHEKREIIYETAWEIVTETVAITTTITIDPATIVASTTPVVISSAPDAPGVFVEPSVTPPTSTSVFIAPTTSTIPVALVEPTSTAPVSIIAPTTATTFSSVFTSAAPIPTTTTTPIPIAPVTSTTPSAAPATTSSSEDTTTACSSGEPCTGDLTFYTTGEGACGWTNDGTVENVVALSYILMGTESNDGTGGMNPYCGKTITVSYGGKTTTALVVDKCMGCDEWSIDLSDLAFSDVADQALGRVSGEWYFNE